MPLTSIDKARSPSYLSSVLFNSGDSPYREWMQTHPDGYVLNASVSLTAGYLVLHRSGCLHIATYTRSSAPDSFTTHRYIKVCSDRVAELLQWATVNRPADAQPKRCRTCQPPDIPLSPPYKMAEEVPEAGTYLEGTVQRVLVNSYERDSRAREACIRHHGASCSVCDFDFGKVYGAIAEGYIHVHHLVPLASIGGVEYTVDPIADLRPVCPNCHAVLHLAKDPLSIDELRVILRPR